MSQQGAQVYAIILGRGLYSMMMLASAQEACSAGSTASAQLHLERVGGNGALQPAAPAAGPGYAAAMAVMLL